ncbi:MAG: hypothetical protein KAV87_67500 [Desulfobacteraceae bacterium]|nr:hypothetical protein [Desulfobacteraceae bacterium]
MDEMKLVYSKGEFDIIMHNDGLVEISAGDKYQIQIDFDTFEEMIHQRRMFMAGR